MKTILYTTLVTSLVLLTACTSIQELVDRGQYDDAIYLAAEKLAGQKKKKTKHIKALEEAFAKVNAVDIDRINYLRAKSDPALWDDIYDIALKIEQRQNRIAPFSPLISKDGYQAYFNFENTNKIKLEAAQHAAAFHYSQGQLILERAIATENKLLARDAFDELASIDRYYESYKNLLTLKEKAHKYGTSHVLVKLDQSIEQIIDPLHMDHREFKPQIEDRFWIDYHEHHDTDITFDLITTLYIDAVNISPEREEINRFEETKSIERWVDRVNRQGEPVKDSLGNIVKIKEIEVLRANIREIKRSKQARLIGRADIRDYSSGDLVDALPMEMIIDFYSEAYSFRGDRDALTDRVRRRVDRSLDPFPSDWAMTADAGHKMIFAYQEFISNNTR